MLVCCRRFDTFDMANDWGRSYDKQLDKSLASIPGSYPEACVEI